jgi:2-oxoglutarate ferredoxin oxidoreductase subunit beta
VARVAVDKPANIMRARGAIKKAFQIQMEGRGLTFVEVLTACPSGWRLTPVEALRWMEDVQQKHYPLGELKKPAAPAAADRPADPDRAADRPARPDGPGDPSRPAVSGPRR